MSTFVPTFLKNVESSYPFFLSILLKFNLHFTSNQSENNLINYYIAIKYYLNVLALNFSGRQTRPVEIVLSVLRTVGHGCDVIAIDVADR